MKSQVFYYKSLQTNSFSVDKERKTMAQPLDIVTLSGTVYPFAYTNYHGVNMYKAPNGYLGKDKIEEIDAKFLAAKRQAEDKPPKRANNKDNKED